MDHIVYAGLAFLYGILFVILMTCCCCCIFVKNKRDCLQRIIHTPHNEPTTLDQPQDQPASIEDHLYDVLEMEHLDQEPEQIDLNNSHVYEDIS